MAIYHLSAKVVSRGKGQSAVAAAAYRSGDPLVDERTGELKSYEARALRIIRTEILAPAHAPEWARDRNRLWNAAERAEKRKDAQLAREIEVSLPHELTEPQRLHLVKDFAREAFVRRGYAVDVAIHTPDRGGDGRNHHAHLMVTMRVLGPDGFSPTKDRSLNSPEQLERWREQWANLANRHLARHGHDARIDHRSLEAQGIDREATTHVGYAGAEIAARGGQSDRRDALDAITARNDLRAELRTTDAELAQLHELVANENRKPRPAPEARRGTRAMGEGPSDDELAQQPEREKAYLAHLQQRHERAQAMLAEQQRLRDLDDRARAFQLAKEEEAEEGRKKQAAQEAESGDGRNGDISSASARYSIAVGQHYDVRDPYASLARAAGAESAAFHKQQEALKAEAAKETDPDKRQAIELRRKIEGCEYMAVTSDRLAGISVAVTGRDDNATAVTDRQQAAHWRATAQGLREERSALLETVQAREEATKEPRTASAPRDVRSAQPQGEQAVSPASTARPEPRAAAVATAPELDDQPREERQGASQKTGPGAMPAPHRLNYRDILEPGRSADPSSATAQPAEPVRAPAAPQAAPRSERPADPAAMPSPTRPDYRKELSGAERPKQPAAAAERPPDLRVIDEHGKDAGTLSAFMAREQPHTVAPYRPPPMGQLLTDKDAMRQHQKAQQRQMEAAQRTEQAPGRLGADLEKGRTVQAEDLRSLNREQWDRVQAKGEAGLKQVVKEAKERGGPDHGGDGRTPRDW